MLEVERRRENKRSAGLHRIRVVQEKIRLGGYLHLASLHMHMHTHPYAALTSSSGRRGFCTDGDALHSLTAAAALPGAISTQII